MVMPGLYSMCWERFGNARVVLRLTSTMLWACQRFFGCNKTPHLWLADLNQPASDWLQFCRCAWSWDLCVQIAWSTSCCQKAMINGCRKSSAISPFTFRALVDESGKEAYKTLTCLETKGQPVSTWMEVRCKILKDEMQALCFLWTPEGTGQKLCGGGPKVMASTPKWLLCDHQRVAIMETKPACCFFYFTYWSFQLAE